MAPSRSSRAEKRGVRLALGKRNQPSSASPQIGTGAGDVAGGAEFRPTDASMETLVELERNLAAARLAYQKLLETDVRAFNELMGSKVKVRD